MLTLFSLVSHQQETGTVSTHKVLRRKASPSTICFLQEGSHPFDLTLPTHHKPSIFHSRSFSKVMSWSLPSLTSVYFCTLAHLIIISCWQYLTLIQQPSRCSQLYNETSDLSGTTLSISITSLTLRAIKIQILLVFPIHYLDKLSISTYFS